MSFNISKLLLSPFKRSSPFSIGLLLPLDSGVFWLFSYLVKPSCQKKLICIASLGLIQGFVEINPITFKKKKLWVW